jgi:aspartyl-tRNA(Asn)/glutamyl-tRNA(Gln) amidotransferase subunit B
MASDNYEAIIGLEVHTHLATRAKLFCGCSTAFGAPPNQNICPVCAGMPGTLPVLNRGAVELALRVGLAMSCEIAFESVFARKSYFYPDLPKGYQITQYELPLCRGGRVELPPDREGRSRTVRLTRIHLEEDAGKNIHTGGASLVDLNRAGVPLLEIVSEPDLRTAQEAGAYLRELREILRYTGASDGRMEEGSLRCDVNVSVRPAGSEQYGVKVEIKNLNSFRFVERAIEYEVGRQIEALAAGATLTQETRLWDAGRSVTRPMRSKEFADDYRYFPEPDLPPLVVAPAWVAQVRAKMPELPAERRTRFTRELGLGPYEAGVLTQQRELADYFEALAAQVTNRRSAANWVMTEVLRFANESNKPLAEAVAPAVEAAALLRMVEAQQISLNAAKTAFAALCAGWQKGEHKSATDLVAELGLAQVSDEAEIAAACDRLLASESVKVAEYRAGRDKLFGFFVGQVMKAMGGRANPKVVNQVLRRKLQS